VNNLHTPTPPRIDHLVVLMLENRSFDHMLGFLRSPEYPIDGLSGDEANPSSDGGPDVRVSHNALAAGDLNPDPGHDFEDVNVQLFGNRAPVAGAPATMKGFVRSYATIDATSRHGASIMKCFAPSSLPILSTLAREYAVCERWFSSVPGPTIPNRMFAHAGTSLYRVVPDPDLSGLHTIFERFDTDAAFHAADYRIYHQDGFTLLLTVPHLIEDRHGFRDYNRFAEDCRHGDLPAYTFIEPRYVNDARAGSFFAANDQHPDHDVMEGERLIRDVYLAIRRNDTLWHSTLLLITYDEHGGIYDHVPPPDIPATGDPSVDNTFMFDRLGLRVPAVLVSPYIAPRTIVRTQFEHSSIIGTVRKLFGPGSLPLGRDATAATFGFETIPHVDTPRTDRIRFPRRLASAAAPPGDTRATELARLMVRQTHRGLRRVGLRPSIDAERVISDQQASDYMRAAARMIADGGTNAPV
jgi:phospholipase C